MKLAELYTQQLEREARITRPVLDRVPEGKNDWKPHEKSMLLGYLAVLVAQIPAWVAMTVTRDEFDLVPKSGQPSFKREAGSRSELLQVLEDSVASARDALRNASDDHLMQPWRLLVGGKVVGEQPRHVMITDAFSHLAHHRGQLTVYFRLLGVPVPAIYGPTADETSF